MDALPDEMLLAVFARLRIDTLRTCASVCGRWCRVSRSDALWKGEYERLVSEEANGVCVRTQSRKQRLRWPDRVPDPYWISCQKVLLYFCERFVNDNWYVDVTTGHTVMALTYLEHRLHDPRASDRTRRRLPDRYCVHRMRDILILPNTRDSIRREAEIEHFLRAAGVSKRGQAGRRCNLHAPFSHLE